MTVPALTSSRPSPATAYLARLSPGSVRSQHQALRTLAGMLAPGLALDVAQMPWEAILPEHAVALRARLVRDYAPATARRILSALRGVMKEAWRLGYIDRDLMERIVDVPPVRSDTRTRAGRMLTESERAALRQGKGTLPLAVLALGLYGGLRRSEIAGVCLEDVDLTGWACLRAVLRINVRGKGGKDRVVTFPDGWAAKQVALRWSERAHGLDLNGCRPNARLTCSEASIPGILRRLAADTGIAPFTCHDLRRTYASLALEKADIVTVQRAMGHADPRTTSQYDRRGEDAQRALAEAMDEGA